MVNLQNVDFIAVTTGFWSDRSSRSYLCMTGHWFDESMDMKSRVLVFAPFNDQHTSVNISSELEQQRKRLKIFEKTTTITCDSVSNMKTCIKKLDLSMKRLQCLAHKFSPDHLQRISIMS